MTFVKYPHLERLGTTEVEDITFGTCHVFYKIDGTNASVWYEGQLRAGSRNRELTVDNDNAGFAQWVMSESNRFEQLFEEYPGLYLYGEWLVPHSLKTYADDAWRKFYIFDVWDKTKFLPYEDYQPILKKYGLDYIPPLAVCKNPSVDQLYSLLERTGEFLIKDGAGRGEGLVVKNYDWKNKFDRQVWAKLVTNEFKEKAHKEMGAPLIQGSRLIEETIVDEFCTEEFIKKEKAKLENEVGSWKSEYIPKLLGVVYYTFIQEETWNWVKKYKNPEVSFKLLNRLVINKIKKVCEL